MKKNITLGLIGWFITMIGGYKAAAQETPKSDVKKETQEIIIRKNGEKDTKVTVEFTGDKILINGKPLMEFNEDGLTINNRKMIIRDGDKITMNFDRKMFDLDNKLKELDALKDIHIDNFSMDFNDGNGTKGAPYTFMGVTTNKVDEGAEITNLEEDGPAAKAGLKEGDIIYMIEDTKITSASDLSKTVRAKKPGDKVKVYFLRNGKKKDEKVVLGSKEAMVRNFTFSGPGGSSRTLTVPRAPMPPMSPSMDNGMFNGNDFQFNMRRQKLGLKIQDTEEGNGVKVLDVESASAAATAGLMKDDVITEIGGVKVNTTDDARNQLQENKDKNMYSVKAKRNGSEMTFNIKIPKNLKTTTL